MEEYIEMMRLETESLHYTDHIYIECNTSDDIFNTVHRFTHDTNFSTIETVLFFKIQEDIYE